MNRTALALVVAAATATGLLSSGSLSAPAAGPAAQTAVRPAAASATAPMSAKPSPTWQTNDSVQGLDVAGSWAYAGGRFTSTRPPNAAAGTQETGQAYLARFDSTSGVFDANWRPVLNGQVWAVAVSPDKSKVYVGGDFTSVNGVKRNRLAAFNASTGALLSWTPSVSYRVVSISVTPDRVYFSGSFGLVNNVARQRAAAVDATTGVLLPFTANAETDVLTINATQDDKYVFMGGRFVTVNGTSQPHGARVDGNTGAVLPFAAQSATPPDTNACHSRPWGSEVVGTTLYVGNAGDGGGCFDGTWSADMTTGQLLWRNACLGATVTVKLVDGWLYKGSHAHDCSTSPSTLKDVNGNALRGFSQRENQYLLRQDPTTGAIDTWAPQTNAAGTTRVGPLAYASGGHDLWVGGDFTCVYQDVGTPGQNTCVGQSGLTHFQPVGVTAGDTGAVPHSVVVTPANGGSIPYTEYRPGTAKPAKPTVTVVGGQVKITWPAMLDNDSQVLTYTISKGVPGSQTVVYSTTAPSSFWYVPTLSWTDSNVTHGTSYQYRLQVSDGTNVSLSNYTDPVTP